jgi:hypothetical protein
MAIADEELAGALRTLLRTTAGFSVGLFNLLEIGQLENLNYWVKSQNWQGKELWYKDDIQLEEAIARFLRIRRERELGFGIEIDLGPNLGRIRPR